MATRSNSTCSGSDNASSVHRLSERSDSDNASSVHSLSERSDSTFATQLHYGGDQLMDQDVMPQEELPMQDQYPGNLHLPALTVPKLKPFNWANVVIDK